MTSCPNDTRQRWPKSSAKTTTQLGAHCPYAHHLSELQFPQTIKTKISAISKIQNNLKGQVDSKKPNKAFIPTGEIKSCLGGCFTSKCNECKFRLMAGSLMTDLDRGTGMPLNMQEVRMKKKCF